MGAVIPGVVQYAAWVVPRVRPLLEEDFAVHDGVVDALSQLPHPPAVVREVMHHVFGDRLHGVGIEDDEVSRRTARSRDMMPFPRTQWPSKRVEFDTFEWNCTCAPPSERLTTA